VVPMLLVGLLVVILVFVDKMSKDRFVSTGPKTNVTTQDGGKSTLISPTVEATTFSTSQDQKLATTVTVAMRKQQNQ